MQCGNPTANLTAANMKYKTGSAPSKFSFTVSTAVICQVGYNFDDFTNENLINCSYWATWTAVPACKRMPFNFIKRISFGKIKLIFGFKYSFEK